MRDITLQLNLSPGDIAYAHLCIPRLAAAHRANVREVVAVVDTCRPQRTKLVDPDIRFPVEAFGKRVAHIRQIAESLRADGHIDRVVYLQPGDAYLEHLADKYMGGTVRETHDYGGCALSGYLAALDVPRTRWFIHYDGDMLLHQEEGYDWAIEAAALLEEHEHAVAATPRVSPPFVPAGDARDAPSRFEGMTPIPVRGGWRNTWMSTRCFLMDGQKLSRYLPLMRGRILLETLAVKYLNRGYPRSPEIMLYRRISGGGGWRLNLASRRAWILHPHSKPPRYVALLPRILEYVGRGDVPDAQRGNQELDLPAWEEYLSGSPSGAARGGEGESVGRPDYQSQ